MKILKVTNGKKMKYILITVYDRLVILFLRDKVQLWKKLGGRRKRKFNYSSTRKQQLLM